MDLGIKGKTALVMGATSGIGNGIARALAAEGARVAVGSRSADRAESAASEIEGTAAGFEADSADLERLAALPDEVSEAFGSPVEILVTNTGGPPLGNTFDVDPGEWEAAYRTLVSAPRVLIEAALPAMRERGWGRIVNVASSSIVEPIRGLALSNSTRMATVGLFKTLSTEVARDGITVNTVATGRFATRRLEENYGSLEAAEEAAREAVPMGRLGQPSEFGDLVAFICSQRASFLTGAVIPLDGGMLRSS
jgi:3-oxoacyl-[acyl-carrier protein] reductase